MRVWRGRRFTGAGGRVIPSRMIRSLYTWVLSRAASPYALWWLGAVAFAESSFFPIPPDALLVPMAVARPGRAFVYAAVCTVASVIGGCLGYYIGAELLEHVAMPLLRLYHAEHALGDFQRLYGRYGVWVILVKGVTLIPYKLVTIASGAAHFDFKVFVLASIATRGARFFLEAALLRRYGPSVQAFLDRRLTEVTLALAAGVVLTVLVARYI